MAKICEVSILSCKAETAHFSVRFQGHINPMLQFSKRLSSKGLIVIMLSIMSKDAIQAHSTYPEIIAKQNSSGFPFKCLVYDSIIPWALDIAKQHGIVGASFFTQSCAVSAMYCHALQGLVTLPIQGPNVSLPADWILFNTVELLEDEAVKWLSSQWPTKIKSIGPTMPSMVDEKRIVHRNEIELCLREVMLGERASLFKANAIKWMKLAREAVDEGGSSDRNIEDFVAEVMSN
ncbi:hypothetical protein RJ641_021771 [Dillenia turbinata]|uniref:Uncharacterized protein n=1 Tax=Dillenia turbinata TaxID=194707 RepID=A0AAN8UFC0_9MAGN